MAPGTIRNKSILITGASSGIGRCTALALANAGSKLVLIARRAKPLQDLETTIRAQGGYAVAYPGDITAPGVVSGAIQCCLHHFGRIDILINNAGVGFFGTIEQTAEEDLDRMLNVNLKGAFHGIRAALPAMLAQGHGHIINVASTAGRRGSPYVGAYCASKFALVGLTESLRTELLGSGIHVSLVCPGATQTEFFQSAVRRTHEHSGLVGPVETPEHVAKKIIALIRHPRAEIMAQPFRRKILFMLNLLAPSLIDRLVAYLVASHRSPANNGDAQT